MSDNKNHNVLEKFYAPLLTLVGFGVCGEISAILDLAERIPNEWVENTYGKIVNVTIYSITVPVWTLFLFAVLFIYLLTRLRRNSTTKAADIKVKKDEDTGIAGWNEYKGVLLNVQEGFDARNGYYRSIQEYRCSECREKIDGWMTIFFDEPVFECVKGHLIGTSRTRAELLNELKRIEAEDAKKELYDAKAGLEKNLKNGEVSQDEFDKNIQTLDTILENKLSKSGDDLIKEYMASTQDHYFDQILKVFNEEFWNAIRKTEIDKSSIKKIE